MATDLRSDLRRPVSLALAIGVGLFLLSKSVMAVAHAKEPRRRRQQVSKPSSLQALGEFEPSLRKSKRVMPTKPLTKDLTGNPQCAPFGHQPQVQLVSVQHRTRAAEQKFAREPAAEMQDRNARVERPDIANSLEDAAEMRVRADSGGAPHKAVQREPPLLDSRSANDTPSYAIPSSVLELAEQSLEQAGTAVSTFIENTRKVTHNLQLYAGITELPAGEALSHVLAFSEQNTAAAFALARNIVRADDLREIMQLQADYAQAQFAALQTQSMRQSIHADLKTSKIPLKSRLPS